MIVGYVDFELFSGRIFSIEVIEFFISSFDGSELIYEGEECILDFEKIVCEDREFIYEGEVVLVE